MSHAVRPRRPFRRLAGALGIAVALSLVGCAPSRVADASSPPAVEVDASPPPAVEVDVDAEVRVQDGAVETACYAYRLPDASWALVPGSAGCTSGIAVDGDVLTMLQVHAVTAAGSIDELAARSVVDDPGAEIARIRLGGHDVARAVSEDAAGQLAFATYVLAYPDSGLTGDGDPVRAIVVSALWSADFEALVEGLVDSLTRPDGSPL